MTALRRRTREAYRHDRAVVVQQVTAPTVDQQRAEWARNRRVADALRNKAKAQGKR